MRQPRLAASHFFTTPPPSDDDFIPPSGNGLLGTCRALQSLLSVSPAPRASSKRLQSPLQLRSPPSARSRKNEIEYESSTTTTTTTSLSPSRPPRGANKRRRDAYESDSDSEADLPRPRFSTPKRQRQLPCDLPLGLSSSDFHSLRSPPVTQSPPSPRRLSSSEEEEVHTSYNPDSAIPSIEDSKPSQEDDNQQQQSAWTPSTDNRLINIVLQKIQLSSQDWADCARLLGQDDHASVGRRWETLLREGNVGLRTDTGRIGREA
ncbi:hypothetical protein BO70DRAFT_297536 [Aspergillus heteromorphus CBS 117.55]|uniref:Myb-like domain-containing protein n=1 Tax=Aspergillus heteromorphus CBS 117.55 TaxID=1448321 RepID=A0A317VLV7_9EURO|nr:uncharacterized protein BO70DRAFT_297536 [Aspergillus heteromorphus CBS 117.55]PWY72890.1 hypothetical protein BO70DRAFT_297536 [Aspergillus heteromorphus CBS 117.55]